MKRLCSKGQMFSLDSVFAIILASFLLIGVVFVSTKTSDAIVLTERSSEMAEATHYAASQLLWTAGNPRNWDENDTWYEQVSSIGLASDKNVLDKRKVEVFFNSTRMRSTAYNVAKNLLGLSRSGYTGSYEFNVVITDINGNTIYDMQNSPSGERDTSSVERLALLNGSIVKVRVDVWVE